MSGNIANTSPTPVFGDIAPGDNLASAYARSVGRVRELATSGDDLEAGMLSAYRTRLDLAERLGNDQESQTNLLVDHPQLRKSLSADLSARQQIQDVLVDPIIREQTLRDAVGNQEWQAPQDGAAAIGGMVRVALASPEGDARVSALVGLHAHISEDILRDPFAVAATAKESPVLAGAILAHRHVEAADAPEVLAHRAARAELYEQQVDLGRTQTDPSLVAQSRAARHEVVREMMDDPLLAMAVGERIRSRETADDMRGATRLEALLLSDSMSLNLARPDSELTEQFQKRTDLTRQAINNSMVEELGDRANDPAVGYVWLSNKALAAERLPGNGASDGIELMRAQQYRDESLLYLERVAHDTPNKVGLRVMEAAEDLQIPLTLQRDIVAVDRSDLRARAVGQSVVVGQGSAGASTVAPARSLWDDAPTQAADPVVAPTGPQARGGVPDTDLPGPRPEDIHIERSPEGYANFNRVRLEKDGPSAFDLTRPYLATGRNHVDRLIHDPDTLAFALPLDNFGQKCSGNIKHAMKDLMQTEEGREQVRSLLEGTRNMRDKSIDQKGLSQIDLANHDRLEMGYRAMLNGVRGKHREEFAEYFVTTHHFMSDEADKQAKLNNQQIHGFMKGEDMEKQQNAGAGRGAGAGAMGIAGQLVGQVVRGKLNAVLHVDRH